MVFPFLLRDAKSVRLERCLVRGVDEREVQGGRGVKVEGDGNARSVELEFATWK